jgi:hypothetical protein
MLAFSYVTFVETPERPYQSQGPNAAWADHKWVAAVQPLEAYAAFAKALRRNRITDVYLDMGRPNPDGTIPAGLYDAAPYMLRELRAQQPALRLHAWIGQLERRSGGPLDLSDAAVRRGVAASAARFLELGFNGIHYSFPGAGSGNAHLLMLLDQTRALTATSADLSLSADALEPIPGLAWLARKTGSRRGFWTRSFYKAVAARVDQIAVSPDRMALPIPWLAASLMAWQTKSIRRLTAGRAVLFMGVRGHADEAGIHLAGSALSGIRKGMSALADDPFDNFGLALDAHWATAAHDDRVLLEDWLEAGEVVAR